MNDFRSIEFDTFTEIMNYLDKKKYSEYAGYKLIDLFGVDGYQALLYAIKKYRKNENYTLSKVWKYLESKGVNLKHSYSERAKLQWEKQEIRKRMAQSMRGPRANTRGKNKSGSLNYIDFLLLQHDIAPSEYGWLSAFICRYRNPDSPNAWRRDPAVSIVRGCERIRKDLKIYVDIERALREYFKLP